MGDELLDEGIGVGARPRVGDGDVAGEALIMAATDPGGGTVAHEAGGHVAVAAGPDELGKLNIYLGTYVTACIVLGLIAMPLLVSFATPIPFFRVLLYAKTAMVTAFAANTVLLDKDTAVID